MLLSTIICSFLAYLLLILFRRYKLEKNLQFLPGPDTLPFIGSLFQMMGDREHIWNKIREFNKEYYPSYRLVFPTAVVINLLNPDDIETVLTSINHIQKSDIYRLIKPWFQEGLLTSFGKKWQKRRKILTPGFHFNVLNKYAVTFFETANKMVDELRLEKEPRIKNLEEWISQHFLGVICETAMGCSHNIFEKGEGFEYKKAADFMGEIFSYRSIRPWLYNENIFLLTTLGKRYKKALDYLFAFSKKIIDERLKETKDNDNNGEIFSDTRKTSMLDILIETYRKGDIDVPGIQEEVNTFIFEGYDTSAMAMIYTILSLAEYKNVQDRAREEVNRVWKESDGIIGVNDIQKLSYLDRVIKESLRLYPSVPIVARNISQELTLKNGVIPQGINLNIHIYDLHRDPNYWEDPLKFDPDRFLIENSKKRHPFAYIPFSGGFRNCIGQKFAMMELKTMVSHLLRYFYIEPIDTSKDVVHQSDIILRPKKKLLVKFVPIPNLT